MTAVFSPGDLVYARVREWVALPSPDDEMLCLRPLSGSETDVQFLHPALEREPVRHARFEMPDLAQLATQDAARLLSQALHLSLRRGAGPFRSAAREDRERHLVLLTATPHSGDEAAFDRLLSLLNDEFAADSLDSEASRIRVARHYV